MILVYAISLLRQLHVNIYIYIYINNKNKTNYKTKTSEYYKHAPLEFKEILLNLFNKIYEARKIPSEFRESIICLIHKNGDRNGIDNYRGITFCNAVYKIFTGILLWRLQEWSDKNNKVNEFQGWIQKKNIQQGVRKGQEEE